MKTNKKCILSIAFVVLLSMGTMLYAGDVILFDPDGTGPMPAVSAITFDWSPGNAVGKGASTALYIGLDIPVLVQANLGSVILNNSSVFQQGNGGNYFTGVVGYTEQVSDVLINSHGQVVGASFVPDLTKPSYFYIYHNTTGNANDLLGTGFTSADLVLSAQIIGDGFQSDYVKGSGTGLMDQYGPDNWNGQLSTTGTGSSIINMQVDSVDNNYFPDLLAGYLYAMGTWNTNQKIPFDEVNPSRQFTDGGLPSSPYYVPIIAPINGETYPGVAYDFLFQLDANGSFTHTGNIPEPTTLLLLGSGLLGLAALRKRS